MSYLTDFNYVNPKGNRPLMEIIEWRRSFDLSYNLPYDIISELLKIEQLDVNIMNKENETALTLATKENDKYLIEMLLDIDTGRIELWNGEKALEV